MDNIKFKARHYQNRNRIRDYDGWTWLSVPVHSSQYSYIHDVNTVGVSATKDAWKVAEASYRGRADYWNTYSDKVQGFLEQKSLLDINLALIKFVADELSVETEFRLASQILPEKSEDRHIFSLNLARKVGATEYLAPVGNIGLHSDIADLGVKIVFQDFVCLPYPQVFDGFHPRMSVLDCLVTHGAEYTRDITEGGYLGA